MGRQRVPRWRQAQGAAAGKHGRDLPALPTRGTSAAAEAGAAPLPSGPRSCCGFASEPPRALVVSKGNEELVVCRASFGMEAQLWLSPCKDSAELMLLSPV